MAGIAVFAQGLPRIGGDFTTSAIEAVGIAVGFVFMAGLWTPITGALVAVLGIFHALSHVGDIWANVLLATLGLGVALVGPGAWSVDARLFGWRQIDIRDRRN